MSSRRRCALMLLLATTGAAAETPEQKGHTIFEEADRRDRGFGDSTADLLMVLRSKQGQESVRNIRIRILEGIEDGDKSLTIFDNPRDVKGTAFLTLTHKVGDDDQWLYLPALKRVKRISSNNKSGSFMGSEFAYEDLVSEEVEKYTYKWLRDAPCPGDEYGSLSCFVVERYPVAKNSGYTRQVVFLDQTEYRIVKIDYYDRKDALLKTLTLTGYRQYLDRHWRPDQMLMVNHQTGKSTRLEWSGYQFDTGLTDNDFNSNSLARVR